MSEQFLGEVRLFSFGLIPKDWIPCDGQLLSIPTNAALYSLLGTTYGGDGKTTFAIPDLRGRVPIHFNQMHLQGTTGGEESHTLTVNEIPQHTHQVLGSSISANEITPKNNVWASRDGLYKTSGSQKTFMNELALSKSGNSVAHNNMQPFLAITFCIATRGIYPPRQ